MRVFFWLLFGVLLIALGFWMSPERLAAIGIMDRSLASDNLLTRETALLEIRLAKIGSFALGILSILWFFFLPRIMTSDWYARLQSDEVRFPAAYEMQQRRFFTPEALLGLAAVFLALLYLIFGGQLFSRSVLGMLNREDGVFESASALLLLIASLLALRVWFWARGSAVGRMHLFLAVLFFAMCGEEISWGQRLFDFETPDALRDLNVQEEINLHNMFGYLFDHLFILCFFVWGCIVPLLYWRSMIWRFFQVRLGLPFASTGLAFVMLCATLMQDQLTDTVFGAVPGLRVPELRELISAICFVLLMMESQTLLPRREQARV